MTLAEVLQKLAFSPLGDLAIGGDGSGVIPPQHVAKLTSKVDDALVALYTRFPLLVRQLTIATVDGLFRYPLRAEYAQTSPSTQPVKFIQDTVGDPFTGDVLRIETVYDGLHAELPMNDRNDPLSWHRVGYDTLQMDYPKTGTSFFVEYRAAHPALPLTNIEPDQVAVHVPASLVPALVAHAAGHAFLGLNMDKAYAKAQTLLSQYEALCAEHELANTFVSSTDSTNRKPELGGWK